ncbi:MAG: transcriptional repressor NrdR [Oscillospiraceae bacterium]|nr:transcriptional repressor NrdR [Oscillospiraceae bacterium]
MRCPYCGFVESKVADSRPTEDGKMIRRRRECLSCGKRFTTFETVETLPLMVIKRDDSRQPFDRNKLINAMTIACGKRPVSMDVIENAVDDIEVSLRNKMKTEVYSTDIGEMAMKKLKEIDEVAYVRFASVYRQFVDVDMFISELRAMGGKE